MKESRLELKRASGWFAAGAEMLQAATLLSDGAFKLFVWICLHAERNSGRLQYTFTDLARVLRKTEDEIRASLNELHQAGFCRFTTDLVEIADRYWPYQRTTSPPVSDDSESYIGSVRRLFLSHACVRSTFSPADERLASEWRRRGISFERVERAIHTGVARKYIALINRGTGTPITTLHYFEHLIDEVEQADASPDYWRHVAARCAQLQRRWRALDSSAHTRSMPIQETK
jgi:hypothetical protein